MEFNLNFSDNIAFNNITCDVTDNVITLDKIPEHCNVYGMNDFYIKNNKGDIPFLLEVIDYNCIKFICAEDIDTSENTILGLKFFSKDRKSIETSSVQIIYKEAEPEAEEVEETEYLRIPKRNITDIPMPLPKGKQTEDWLLGINIKKDFMTATTFETYLEFRMVGEFIHFNFEDILIEKFELNTYDDYPIQKDVVEFDREVSEERKYINRITYPIDKNFIYRISFMYKDEEYEFCYIHEKPDIYFTSVSEVKKALTGENLSYGEDVFGLKLRIWNLSSYAFSVAGLSRIDMAPYKKSVMSEYIKTKIIYDLLKDKINNVTFDDALFEEKSKVENFSITDFSTSVIGSSQYQILVGTLKQYYAELNKLEDKMIETFRCIALKSIGDYYVKSSSTKHRIDSDRKVYRGW